MVIKCLWPHNPILYRLCNCLGPGVNIGESEQFSISWEDNQWLLLHSCQVKLRWQWWQNDCVLTEPLCTAYRDTCYIGTVHIHISIYWHWQSSPWLSVLHPDCRHCCRLGHSIIQLHRSVVSNIKIKWIQPLSPILKERQTWTVDLIQAANTVVLIVWLYQ